MNNFRCNFDTWKRLLMYVTNSDAQTGVFVETRGVTDICGIKK